MTPTLVVDASVSASWCFPNEASPLFEAVFDEVARRRALVPALWLFEMADVLTIAERRGRIASSKATVIRNALAALAIELDQTLTLHSLSVLVSLARTYDLTAYDAAYLDLALRSGATLASHDVALQQAATRAGIPHLEA